MQVSIDDIRQAVWTMASLPSASVYDLGRSLPCYHAEV